MGKLHTTGKLGNVVRGLMVCALLAGISSCTGEAEVSLDTPTFTVPKNFPAPAYALDRNRITSAGVELGRTLFFDPKLSRDKSISCAECHSQPNAFTHHGHDVSHGIDNRVGTRNSLPIQNLAWSTSFFWDGGVLDLDLVPVAPIENPLEMDETLYNVLEKLRKDSTYPKKFKAAFGTEEVTTARFLQALSQYMLTLVSANSRYDKYVRNEGGTLSADELAGKQLFVQKGCVNCHAGELFTDNKFRNNGLSLAFGTDLGRGRITEAPQDNYTFKVPSLRNVGVSYPYMHDGRFRTLEAVLDHYAEGVTETPNLDPLLKQNGRLGIPMTAGEKASIIAFLKTLTDEEFLKNPQFIQK